MIKAVKRRIINLWEILNLIIRFSIIPMVFINDNLGPYLR